MRFNIKSISMALQICTSLIGPPRQQQKTLCTCHPCFCLLSDLNLLSWSVCIHRPPPCRPDPATYLFSPASHCIAVIWTSVKVVGLPPPLVSLASPFLLNQLRLMGLSVQTWLRIKFNPIWLPFLLSKARTITIWWRLPALTNKESSAFKQL